MGVSVLVETTATRMSGSASIVRNAVTRQYRGLERSQSPSSSSAGSHLRSRVVGNAPVEEVPSWDYQ